VGLSFRAAHGELFCTSNKPIISCSAVVKGLSCDGTDSLKQCPLSIDWSNVTSLASTQTYKENTVIAPGKVSRAQTLYFVQE